MFEAIPPGSARWVAIPDAPVPLEAYVIRGLESGPTAAVVAGIHGDEYEGPAAVFDLAAALGSPSIRGTLALIPIANPSAFAAGTRTSPEDGANLARTFPGDPLGPPTARLAAALFAAIGGADALVDLHSGGVACEFRPVAGFYGEPAPANPSFAAAVRFGLPALWQLPSTPGVLSHEMARRGAKVVGCEYLGGGRLDPLGRAAYRAGVLACLGDWGLLLDAENLPAPAAPVFEGDWIVAEEAGLFERVATLGELVPPGAEVARIVGPRGTIARSIVAEGGGTVLGLRCKASILPGDWAALIGTPLEVERG